MDKFWVSCFCSSNSIEKIDTQKKLSVVSLKHVDSHLEGCIAVNTLEEQLAFSAPKASYATYSSQDTIPERYSEK